MGGYGSGRRGGFTVNGLTGDYLHLDIRTIKRNGCLSPGTLYSWGWTRRGGSKSDIRFKVNDDNLQLSYKSREKGGEWFPLEYEVAITKSSCYLGGERVWFLCPGRGCGKRVAILYGGKYFLCRDCAGLVYASQRETDLDRMTRKIDRIRERLKWTPGFLNGPEWKPKGMHWRTFRMLRYEHERLTETSLSYISDKFGFKLF